VRFHVMSARSSASLTPSLTAAMLSAAF
jgi:hypothetical protein